MKRTELVLAGLLAGSLLFSLVTWNQLQDLKDEQEYFYAQTNEIDGLRNQLHSLRNEIKGMTQEKAWIRDVSFNLDEEKSNFDTAYLEGRWNFSELNGGQSPYLLLKEEGGEWKRFSLENLAGLTYDASLELSTQKKYQYKLVTEGGINRSTEIRRIPYERYGVPEPEVKYSSNQSSDNEEINLSFMAAFDPDAPIQEMVPAEVLLEVKKGDRVIEQVPFNFKERGNAWEVNWTLENEEMFNEYQLFLVTKFDNGTTQRKELNSFRKEDVKT